MGANSTSFAAQRAQVGISQLLSEEREARLNLDPWGLIFVR